MRGAAITACLLLAGACGTAPQSASQQRPTPATGTAQQWEELIAADDGRIAMPQQLETVRTSLGSGSAFLRMTAVRALGRTERPELLPLIVPLLHDSSDSVRTAAAHAVGDVARETGAAGARSILLDALPAAGAAGLAGGAMAETLGRLAADAAAARQTVDELVPFLAHDDTARTGALRGLYFLARQPEARAAVAGARDALRRIALGGPGPTTRHVRERTLALSTLALARAADEATLTRALQDTAAYVRREAAAAASTLSDTAAVRRIATLAAADQAGAVRYEAVRIHAARLAATHGCAPVVDAVRDRDVHVSLLAIDLLGSVCRSRDHAPLLDSIISRGATPTWQPVAHAVVSLAATDAGRARTAMHQLASHASPFARTYVARAAASAADTALLYRLARDPHANVRTAAVTGLAALMGRAADTVFLAQLASDESELLMAAAAALEGSRHNGAAERLLDALDRVSALQWETSRDGRAALLERIGELGGPALAERLRPYLRDFDPLVAERAAGLLETWTGTRPVAAPEGLPSLPLPTFAEAEQLAGTTFVVEMEGGGEIVMRLLPFDAPTNAARFARLARSGYFDGLTVHRVVPNFVVQGGSPGANEYSGDGPFSRDELAVPNWRGSVGLSTRGRDTGDAQFYVNLIDNVRLDHQYTVFAVITRGMDVVDGLLEGAAIRRVREQPMQ